MSELSIGTLVQHVSLGVGKVVALEPNAVHVFFRDREARFAAKLRLPDATRLIRTDGVARDAWLEGLSAFALDEGSGRYALAANFVTHEQAIAGFLKAYPKGFADAAYIGTGTGKKERASRWRAATAEWAEAFGGGEAERLIEAGKVKELLKRVLRIEKHVVQVAGTFEEGALTEALADPETSGPFVAALLELLSVPSPGRARFEKLFTATEALDLDPALAWAVATVFPFVADPSRHVFLWPKTACSAAERLGCNLRYDTDLKWATYSALRAFSTQLLEPLRAHAAKDFVDVEAFLFDAATRRPTPSAAPRRSR